MEQFTEQEFIEIRALIDAYKNGKTIANLPAIDNSEQDYNQLLLEVYNTKAQAPGRIPVSLFKGLVDISGWTGKIQGHSSNQVIQITEKWKQGAMYVVYYSCVYTQPAPAAGQYWHDYACVFVHPLCALSEEKEWCYTILLDTSTHLSALYLKPDQTNGFTTTMAAIYRIYRVK